MNKSMIVLSNAMFLLVLLCFASTGGPDSFGYRWIDSEEPGGPNFEWFDISGTGTSGPSGDDGHIVVSLPSDFEFYGTNYNQITICTNGWSALGSWSTGDWYVSTIPSTDIPQNVLAPFYTDMYADAGDVKYETLPDGKFVISYNGIRHLSGSGDQYWYQIVLDFARKAVKFNYLDVLEPPTSTGHVGIENESGTVGLLFGSPSASGPLVIYDSLSIVFRSDLVVAPPYFDDCYSSGDMEHEGTVDDWEHGLPGVPGPPAAYSFPYCWGTKRTGNYTAYSNSILMPPRMSIAGTGQVIFDWRQWYDTELGVDGGVVEITTNDGSTWEVAYPEMGYPCTLGAGSAIAGLPAFSGSSGGWEYQSIDLSPYIPFGEVRLRFHFGANGTNQMGGWYIDDIGLSESFGALHGFVDLDYHTLDGGAKVEIPDLGLWDISDDSGYYFIDSVRVGTWDVICTRDSFADQEVPSVTFTRNDTVRVDFLMPPVLFATNFDTNSAGGIPNPTEGWQWGMPDSLIDPYTAHSDSLCWGTNLHGNYMNNANWTLEFQVFLVAEHPHMQVFHWYKFAGEYAGYFWDGGNVKAKGLYDTTWTLVYPDAGYDGLISDHNSFLGGEPGFGGEGYGDFWRQDIFDLSNWAMDTAIVRFEIGSDGAGTARGWYIDDMVITDYSDTNAVRGSGVLPERLTIEIYPNPFNAVTNIELSVPSNQNANIAIYDLSGRLVKTLADDIYMRSGSYRAVWDGRNDFGRDVATGVYLAKIETADSQVCRKLLLIK